MAAENVQETVRGATPPPHPLGWKRRSTGAAAQMAQTSPSRRMHRTLEMISQSSSSQSSSSQSSSSHTEVALRARVGVGVGGQAEGRQRDGGRFVATVKRLTPGDITLPRLQACTPLHYAAAAAATKHLTLLAHVARLRGPLSTLWK